MKYENSFHSAETVYSGFDTLQSVLKLVIQSAHAHIGPILSILFQLEYITYSIGFKCVLI